MDKVNIRAYVGALAALSAALAASWAYSFGIEAGLRYALGAVVLGSLSALAELFPIRVSELSEISAVDVGLIAAVAVVGPIWAALAALPCALVEGNRDPLRTCYAASRNAAEVLLAGTVFSFASQPLLSSGDPALNAPAVYATFAAALTLHVANNTFDAMLLKIKYRQAFGRTWEELISPYLASDVINVLTVVLGAVALLVYGPVAALVVVTGSVGSLALVLRSRELRKEVGIWRRRCSPCGGRSPRPGRRSERW